MSVAHHHDAHNRPASQMNRVPTRNIGHRRYLRQCPGHAIHSPPCARTGCRVLHVLDNKAAVEIPDMSEDRRLRQRCSIDLIDEIRFWARRWGKSYGVQWTICRAPHVDAGPGFFRLRFPHATALWRPGFSNFSLGSATVTCPSGVVVSVL